MFRKTTFSWLSNPSRRFHHLYFKWRLSLEEWIHRRIFCLKLSRWSLNPHLLRDHLPSEQNRYYRMDLNKVYHLQISFWNWTVHQTLTILLTKQINIEARKQLRIYVPHSHLNCLKWLKLQRVEAMKTQPTLSQALPKRLGLNYLRSGLSHCNQENLTT